MEEDADADADADAGRIRSDIVSSVQTNSAICRDDTKRRVMDHDDDSWIRRLILFLLILL